MNKLLFSLLLLVLSVHALNAQDTKTTAAPMATNDQEIRKATEALTAKYQLNADQAKQMYTIQARKAKNLAQIESMKSSDPALYRSKALNVQKGTLANIQRILNTKDQVALYKITQSDLRVQRNKKQKEMVGKNASREAIENALLAIYAE
jgi:preprotein translocase subunit SecF